MVVGQVVLFLNVELAFDVLPVDCAANSRRDEVEADPSASPFRRFVARRPPVLVRLVFRSAYVGAM